MTAEPYAGTRKRYADLWADYVRYGVSTDGSAPIALVVDARTEEAVQRIAAEIADGHFRISRKRWPFGRRWRLMLKTRPMPLARARVDEWFESFITLLRRYDADMAHWVPLREPPAA